MELLLGVLIGVMVAFLAPYLTRKLKIEEEQLQNNRQNDRHLLELADQIRELQSKYRYRSQYVMAVKLITLFHLVL